jgi:hypothetical protein
MVEIAIAGIAGSALESPATAPSHQLSWVAASTAWRRTTSPPLAIFHRAAFTVGTLVTALVTANAATHPRTNPLVAEALRGPAWCARTIATLHCHPSLTVVDQGHGCGGTVPAAATMVKAMAGHLTYSSVLGGVQRPARRHVSSLVRFPARCAPEAVHGPMGHAC